MKKWLQLVICAFLCFSGTAYVAAHSETAVLTEPAEQSARQDGQTYLAGNPEDVAAVILHTNDVHVALEDLIGYDGLAYQEASGKRIRIS